MIDEFRVVLAKRTFKGYSEEHTMIKVNEFMSLSEGKTLSGRFPIDCTKTFEGIEIPHRKQGCLDCDNGKICSECVINFKMHSFNCEMGRGCKTCSDWISQEKTHSTDIIMLNRKPPSEYYQMLPFTKGIMDANKITKILNLREKFWWKKITKWLWKDDSRGYIIWWSVNRTWKTKILLKTKRYFDYRVKHIKTKNRNL